MQIANFVPVRLAFVSTTSRFVDAEEVDPKLVEVVKEVNRLAIIKTRATRTPSMHQYIDSIVSDVMRAGTINKFAVATAAIEKLNAL